MEGYESTPTMRLHLVRQLITTWNKYPTLRLGQLIACITKDEDLFNLDDEQFLSMVKVFENEYPTTAR